MEDNSISVEKVLEKIQSLSANIEKVIKGKGPQIRYVLTALLAKGHVLMEDNPEPVKQLWRRHLQKVFLVKVEVVPVSKGYNLRRTFYQWI